VVRGGTLVGAVSRQNIMDALATSGNSYVQGVMTRSFQTALPEDSLVRTLGRITGAQGAQLLPVMQGERIVGIVTPQNLSQSMGLLNQSRRIHRPKTPSATRGTATEEAKDGHGATRMKTDQQPERDEDLIRNDEPSSESAADQAPARPRPVPRGHAHRQSGRHHPARPPCPAFGRPHRLRGHAPDPENSSTTSTIRTPTISYHMHNEAGRAIELAAALKAGARIAVVSDAGTPGIADPGGQIAAAAIAAGVPVFPIPGANAAISALIASGLVANGEAGEATAGESFTFHGFLPSKEGQRRTALEALRKHGKPNHRHADLLRSPAPHSGHASRYCRDLRPTQHVVVARELTKLHEEFLRGLYPKCARR